ncbi:MAG: hypothetical protein IPJ71_15295 [Bdellovibrionales bacterium]|nr:hypothetical protein [Bdellovibrionales bacterium]
MTKLQARFDTLEPSQDFRTDGFFDEFRGQLKVARKNQDLISKKADPRMR